MSTPKPKTIYEALSAAGIDFSGMSWSGFNVYGDTASIKELRRLQHQDYVAEYLRKELLALRDQVRTPAADTATLGPDEPHPAGTSHDEWVAYERKVAADARGRIDVI